MPRLRAALPAIVLALTPAAALADEPVIFGGRYGLGGWNYPLASPPGWFGPGPAGGYGSPSTTDWQYYGVPNGPRVTAGISTFNRGYFGPGYFGIPGAAGGFWTNGLSLYGPPIPTYAPTPGSFGNADLSRLYFVAPPPAYGSFVGIGFGGNRGVRPPLGWASDRFNPSPRDVPPTVSVNPPVQVIPGPPVTTTDGAPCLRMQIVLADANADLWIEKTATAQRGTARLFESPALEAGKRYEYELIARWHEQGKERAETRRVSGTAGQSLRVDFTAAAEPTPAAVTLLPVPGK